jgi:hypothetical protein
MIPASVFQLGRMRHLDLLTLWCQLNPDGHMRDPGLIGRLSKDRLAAELAPSWLDDLAALSLKAAEAKFGRMP